MVTLTPTPSVDLMAATFTQDNVNWLHFDDIISTQDFVEREYANFPKDKMTVVSADFQSQGCGSGTRKFLMPRGCGIMMTTFFKVPGEAAQAIGSLCPDVVRLLALCAVETLAKSVSQQAGRSFQIKWPNDIMCNGKKVGGILAKAVACDDQQPDCLDGVIMGISININSSGESLTLIERPVRPATSLAIEYPIHQPFDVAAIRSQLVEAFLAKLSTYFAAGIERFLKQLAQHQMLMGMRVRVVDRFTSLPYEGEVTRVDETHRLVVQCERGIHSFLRGDVRPLRPYENRGCVVIWCCSNTARQCPARRKCSKVHGQIIWIKWQILY